MASRTVKPRIVVAVILLALVLILIVQNSGTVALRVLVWEATLSKVLLILITTAIGFAAGFLVAMVTRRRWRQPPAGEPPSTVSDPRRS